jgi:hypothetical protein
MQVAPQKVLPCDSNKFSAGPLSFHGCPQISSKIEIHVNIMNILRTPSTAILVTQHRVHTHTRLDFFSLSILEYSEMVFGIMYTCCNSLTLMERPTCFHRPTSRSQQSIYTYTCSLVSSVETIETLSWGVVISSGRSGEYATILHSDVIRAIIIWLQQQQWNDILKNQ